MKTPRLGAALVFMASLAAPAAVRSAEPPNTVIESRGLDMHSTDAETISVFTGNVVVTGNDMRITCDRLEVVSVRIGDKTDIIGRQENFKSLIATGHVHMVQLDREASCGRAVVLPREEKVTLTDGPVVIDHGNNTVATGEPIVLLHGEYRVLGTNVRITFAPIKNLGLTKNTPAPAPEASATAPQK
jgi:lipopolysaccharide export system protein LptA